MSHPLLLTVGAIIGYAILMRTNPVRPSLRDGLRCVRRYPQLWLLPASFALVHSGFRLWRHEYETRLVAGEASALLPWSGWQPPPWTDAVAASWLPTAEGVATIFNCVVTTFPLSALAAAVFLVNWRGYQGAVLRALRRRLGSFFGVGIHAGLLLSALAAMVKPVLFGGLIGLNGYWGAPVLLRAGAGIDALGFVFEYLLGVGVQIYLVLLCFVWIRGLSFDFEALRRFALRRFAFVVKWAAVVIVVSTVGINVPLLIDADGADALIHGTRWLLAVGLIVFCSMQVHLIFHNESLRQALADHLRLVRRHGEHVAWFVAIVALHYFVLGVADGFLPLALGVWTWPSAGWSLVVHPLLWTALAAWALAGWVCLFRRCERNLADADELVPY